MRRLILFTRFPRPGDSKTRLIPQLGAELAAELQRRLVEHVLRRIEPLLAQPEMTIELRYTPRRDGEALRRWLCATGHAPPAPAPALASQLEARSGRVMLTPQGQGHLGQRMHQSFVDAHRAGTSATLLIGSDVPGIDRSLLQDAFSALDEHDVVLGPAHDGGYYLIGLRRPRRELFQQVPWGTSEVLEHTLARVREAGLRYAIGPPLSDIDRPADLSHLLAFADLAHFGPAEPRQ